MKHSTSKPTKEEAAYIVACKENGCAACHVLRDGGQEGCDGEGSDFNHMKSGNIRMGHMYGYALCAWHHRRVPLDGWPISDMIIKFGHSLMDGGKTFHLEFGSDNELLERQRRYLEGQ